METPFDKPLDEPASLAEPPSPAATSPLSTVDAKGELMTAALARGAWKRALESFKPSRIVSFVPVPDAVGIPVHVVQGPNGIIMDPTPHFKPGELPVLWSHAQHIARDILKGQRVLVLYRAGKNRSAFLAGLAHRMLAFDAPTLAKTINVTSPSDPHLVHLLSSLPLLKKCGEIDSDIHELLAWGRKHVEAYTASHTASETWNPRELFAKDWNAMEDREFENWVTEVAIAKARIMSYTNGAFRRSEKKRRFYEF